MAKATLKQGLSIIQKRGVALVFPIQNAKEPTSLWGELYPRSEMRWEWDSAGDSRVALLWHLREELSRSGKVVYAKWYRGRATFFSHDAFVELLAVLQIPNPNEFSAEARKILNVLGENSPLSTKQLKKATGLTGREFDAAYTRGLNELWQRLWIVGYGEIDDGAFPSLAVGASEVLFEDLVDRARGMDRDQAWEQLQKRLGASSLFLKHVHRIQTPRRTRSEGKKTGNVFFGWGGVDPKSGE